MRFREQVPIRTQITILPVISLVGFVAVLLLLYSGITYQAKVNQINLDRLALIENLQKFQSGMTTLRISEKKFFADKKIADMVTNVNAVDALFKTLNSIHTDRNPIISAQQVHEWVTMLEDYQRQYIDATTELSVIGFSENMGLRGSMRNAIHIIEARIKDKNPELMRDMLSVRRHEKDFIIRLKDESYIKWEASIRVFNNNLEQENINVVDKAVINFLWPIYADSFRKMADHKRDLVIDGNEVDFLSKNILRSLNKARANALVYARTATQQEFNKTRMQFRIIAILAAIIGIFTFIVSYWIGGGIRMSLMLITRAMTRLTAGNIETNIPMTSYTNEIGAMTNALCVFRENEKLRRVDAIHLTKAKRQTENIIQTMNEALFELDQHGVINMTNPAAADLLGLNPDDFIGRKLSHFFVGNDKNKKNLYDTARLSLFSADLENKYFEKPEDVALLLDTLPQPLLLFNANGQLIWGNITAANALGYTLGELAGLRVKDFLPQWLSKDYTKHFTNKLGKMPGRLITNGRGLAVRHRDGSKIEMSIGLVSFLIGHKKHFLFVCKREGIDKELGVFSDTKMSCPFGSLELRQDIVRFVLPADAVETIEHNMITAHGKTITVSYSGALLRDDHNCIIGAIVTVRDITDRKTAELAKAEFIATISHELRTPLTSIKGALSLLNAGVVGAMNEKSQSLVSIALNNSNRLAVLINEILDFEKIEAGQMKYNMEPMDLSNLVHEAIEANGSYAEKYGVQFTSKGADKPVIVKGDSNRLMQVLTNLMSNAAKFSNKGGNVEVSLTHVDNKVRVAIKDTGVGIPKVAQKTIFEKFTQVDSSDEREKGGTGLGLNIVKNMVEAHGSTIAFESVEGKGSKFYFDLDNIETALVA